MQVYFIKVVFMRRGATVFRGNSGYTGVIQHFLKVLLQKCEENAHFYKTILKKLSASRVFERVIFVKKRTKGVK